MLLFSKSISWRCVRFLIFNQDQSLSLIGSTAMFDVTVEPSQLGFQIGSQLDLPMVFLAASVVNGFKWCFESRVYSSKCYQLDLQLNMSSQYIHCDPIDIAQIERWKRVSWKINLRQDTFVNRWKDLRQGGAKYISTGRSLPTERRHFIRATGDNVYEGLWGTWKSLEF